jgi:hypothetical protein
MAFVTELAVVHDAENVPVSQSWQGSGVSKQQQDKGNRQHQQAHSKFRVLVTLHEVVLSE